jgi:hypothetical protein
MGEIHGLMSCTEEKPMQDSKRKTVMVSVRLPEDLARALKFYMVGLKNGAQDAVTDGLIRHQIDFRRRSRFDEVEVN